MANDSSTRGYLAPLGAPPPDDDDLADILQAMVVGITGLDGALVRPRWQPRPPPVPPVDVNWCAIGITARQGDYLGAVIHDGAGEGTSTHQRHEDLEVLATFYGPAANGYASRLRDGLSIAQNREPLFLAGIAYVAPGAPVQLSDEVGALIRRRVDLPLQFRRQTDRTYAVLNLRSAQGGITEGTSTTPILVEP
ncbi:phage neck terminator protein [Salinarimonas soli]|uniref:Phage neck terminator protein gp12-like domain-containing protein n=1 Tax=Salinarimonas soli TaxID=1638099 RepID=A0A5B2VDR8_9HYPH|nr:hypothetical protein [Salinarimonas soli]KAA2237673.1 hypothetical protein F0L46_08305 [Salinarimonas soli]